MDTQLVECSQCGEERIASSVLNLPCCNQVPICFWCLCNSAEIQHEIPCSKCSQVFHSPFKTTSNAGAKVGKGPAGKNRLRKCATLDLDYKSPIRRQSVLESSNILMAAFRKDGDLREVGNDNDDDDDGSGDKEHQKTISKPTTCQVPQCPYPIDCETKLPCFHCGIWLCEMHELSHTNELSDKLLIDLDMVSSIVLLC